MRHKEVMFLFLLLSIGVVVAQPPFQQTSAEISIQIETPVIEVHKAGEMFDFHAHAHNSSDGVLLTNDTTICLIHIYKPSNGEHILEQNLSFSSNLIDFTLEVEAGNFTEVGQYAVYLYCEVPGERAGFFEYAFDVTQTGDFIDTGETFRYIIILIILLIFFGVGLYVSIVTPYGNIEEATRNGTFVVQVTKTKYFKLVAIWLTSGVFMWFINIITGMINNYTKFQPVREITTNLYLYLNIIWYVVVVAIVWLIFYNIWKDIILNKTVITEGKALIKKTFK